MKKLVMPALGAAFVLGAPQLAAADGILLSQLMLQGQPGVTGNVNRTVPPGNPGVSTFNVPAPGPYAFPSVPTGPQPTPYIGSRGDLNHAEPELVGPGERDETGRIGPTTRREQARFAGERGPDGKLLPTYAPDDQQAQAQQPSPQTMPPPPPSQMQREQQMQRDRQMQRDQQMQRRPDSGTMGQSAARRQLPNATSMLNTLSAEGYRVTSDFRRVGNQWEAQAMKGDRTVTVQIDPATRQITER